MVDVAPVSVNELPGTRFYFSHSICLSIYMPPDFPASEKTIKLFNRMSQEKYQRCCFVA